MRKKKSFILFTIIISFLLRCNFNYLDYSQHIESPDKKYNYCLYFDTIGIGDPGYYILKLDKNINPKKLYINWNYKKGIKTEDREWIDDKTILYNYEEGSDFSSNPKIEILNNRFLIFSRGGYYFGLYDTKIEKAIYNIGSPWNEWFDWYEKSGLKGKRVELEKERKSYGQWIKINLNDKIKDYIKSNI